MNWNELKWIDNVENNVDDDRLYDDNDDAIDIVIVMVMMTTEYDYWYWWCFVVVMSIDNLWGKGGL